MATQFVYAPCTTHHENCQNNTSLLNSKQMNSIRLGGRNKIIFTRKVQQPRKQDQHECATTPTESKIRTGVAGPSARCFGDFDQRNVLSRALTHFFQKFGSLAPQDANVAEQCQSIIIKRGISFSHCLCWRRSQQ